jgi:hypothetical protein
LARFCPDDGSRAASRTRLFFTGKELTMALTQQGSPAPHPAEVAELGVPTFFVSSFNLSATSNEVVLVGNELFPAWSGAA